MASTATKKIWEPVDLSVYFIFIRWTVLVAVIVEILFRFGMLGLSDSTLGDGREMIVWIWRALVFIFLGWRTLKNFGPSRAIAIVTGLTSGLIMGLIAALYRFVEGFKVWKIFNIFTETVWSAAVGLAVTVIVVYLINLISGFRRQEN